MTTSGLFATVSEKVTETLNMNKVDILNKGLHRKDITIVCKEIIEIKLVYRFDCARNNSSPALDIQGLHVSPGHKKDEVQVASTILKMVEEWFKENIEACPVSIFILHEKEDNCENVVLRQVLDVLGEGRMIDHQSIYGYKYN